MRKIFIILFSVIIQYTFATTYYVSNAGNDANNGTSSATSWKTLGYVRSHLVGAISPGDSILLKRGDIWKETLNLPGSGSSGNLLVIGTYSTGAKPIITKRDTLWGWSIPARWTQSGSAWYIVYPTAASGSGYHRLWIDGTEVKSNATTSVTSTLKWTYDYNTTRFYIYSATNPATTFLSIETFNADTTSSTNTVSVYADVKNYVKLLNLDIRGAFTAINITNGTGWIIDSCDIGMDCGGNGIAAAVMNSVEVKNCYMDTGDRLMDNFNAQNSADGVHLSYACNDWLVHNNTFIDWGHSTLAISNTNLANPSRRNKWYNNYITVPDIDYGRAFNFDDVDTTTTGTGTEVYNNYAYIMPTVNQFNSRGLSFHNNVINKVNGVSYASGDGVGISLDGYSSFVAQNMTFYNNTIANCADYGIGIGNVNGTKKNNLFVNNIVYNCDTVTSYQVYILDDPTVQNNTFQNNLLYKSGVTNLVYFGQSATNTYPHTIAAFNGENGTGSDVITNNIGGDPVFFSTTNFKIRSSSPAVNAGLNVGIPYRSIAPDIGAFELSGQISKYNGKILKYNGKFVVQ